MLSTFSLLKVRKLEFTHFKRVRLINIGGIIDPHYLDFFSPLIGVNVL
jgi:hypothetical protein